SQKMKFPRHIEEARIRCPRCHITFQATQGHLQTPGSSETTLSAPGPEPVAEPEPPPGPMLTSPHRCHQCKQSIKEPTGKQATTVNCPWCKYRTSIYAV